MNNITVVGLDVGAKRIGVAKGDLSLKIASPLKPLIRDKNIFEKVADVIRENGAQIVVVGLPRNSNGDETAQSEFSRIFAKNLAAATDVKIVFQDESLTSIEAEKNLRGRKDFRETSLRDGTLDSEAAALILQDFLEENGEKYGGE